MFASNHLNRLSLVQIDFNIWSGQAKLNSNNESQNGFNHKGLIKLIDPVHLRPFNRLKTKARRICLAHGMPFLNGFAIPLERVDIIISELEVIEKEMRKARKEFLHRYESYLLDWTLSNPKYVSILNKIALSKDTVKEKLGFNYQIFKISPFNKDQEEKINKKVSNLGQFLINEIVEESKQFFTKNLEDKTCCQINTKKTLIKLRYKVDGLIFLDDRLISVIKLLDSALFDYERSSSGLTGEALQKVMHAMQILSSEDMIIEFDETHNDDSSSFVPEYVDAKQSVMHH